MIRSLWALVPDRPTFPEIVRTVLFAAVNCACAAGLLWLGNSYEAVLWAMCFVGAYGGSSR